MPKKKIANESVAAAPVRAANPKNPRTSPVVEVVSKPRGESRVKSVKHSKAGASPVVIVEINPPSEAAPLSAHDQIARIAYGYWEARGFQPGSPEQDWLRAEREYLAQA